MAYNVFHTEFSIDNAPYIINQPSLLQYKKQHSIIEHISHHLIDPYIQSDAHTQHAVTGTHTLSLL